MNVLRNTAWPNRAERRRVVLDKLGVALSVLFAQGDSYNAISIDRLVSQAGISRSGFYVHFEDKGDLLLALTDDVVEELVMAASPWWALERPSRDELDDALRQIVDTYVPHGGMWQAIAEGSANDSRLRERLDSAMDAGINGLVTHISSAQDRGAIAADVDAPAMAGWLIWMIERGLSELVRAATAPARERLVQALAHIIHRALYDTAPKTL